MAKRKKKEKKKKKILFVCSGNTCRSPMAVGLLRAMLDQSRYEIISAGLATFGNAGANAHAMEAMEEEEIDISDHVSMLLTGDLLEEADVVFVMTKHHQKDITSWFKSMGSKVHLLREFDQVRDDPHYPDVPDPVGQGEECYRKCREMIRRSLKGALKIL